MATVARSCSCAGSCRPPGSTTSTTDTPPHSSLRARELPWATGTTCACGDRRDTPVSLAATPAPQGALLFSMVAEVAIRDLELGNPSPIPDVHRRCSEFPLRCDGAFRKWDGTRIRCGELRSSCSELRKRLAAFQLLSAPLSPVARGRDAHP